VWTRRRPVWILAAVFVAAAVLRFYALGREALWCDEAYTALTSRLPLKDLFTRQFTSDDAPPLFYLLEKLSISIAGDSEGVLRAVSALAGLLAVGILLWRAYRQGGAAHAWSAAYLAVAAYGIFHARQARSYSLLILLALVLILSAREMLGGKRRAGPLLMTSALLLVLTHNVAVVLVMSSLVLWPLGAAGKPRLRSWFLWHLPALAVWALLWILASAQLQVHAQQNFWTAHYWETHLLGLAPLYSIGVYLPGALPFGGFSGFATSEHVASLWTILSVVLGGVVLLAVLRRRPKHSIAQTPLAHRDLLLDAAFLFLPLLALLAASLIFTPVYVLTRTDALAYPAFALLIGRGLANLPCRAAGGILLFWALLSVGTWGPTYGHGKTGLSKGTDRRVAEQIAEGGLAPDDWVVHTFMTAPSIEFYLERADAPHRTAWFPTVAGQNIASTWTTPLDSLPGYLDDAFALRREMEGVLPEDGATWVFAVIDSATTMDLTRESGPKTLTVEKVCYPVSVLVYALVGGQQFEAVSIYKPDWLGGRRIVLRLPRTMWLPVEDLPPFRGEPQAITDTAPLSSPRWHHSGVWSRRDWVRRDSSPDARSHRSLRNHPRNTEAYSCHPGSTRIEVFTGLDRRFPPRTTTRRSPGIAPR